MCFLRIEKSDDKKKAGRINDSTGFLSNCGAGHEIRTRDFNLGKVALYH